MDLDTIIEGMLEFSKHIPSDDKQPEALVVLKGHLLIERELMKLIEIKSLSPKALNKSRFSFKNKLSIVEALYGDTTEIDWDHISTLNSIRNSNQMGQSN